MAEPLASDIPENWFEVGKQIAAGAATQITQQGLHKTLVAAQTDGAGAVMSTIWKVLPEAGALMGKGIVLAEDIFAPLFAGFVSAAVGHIFGTHVSASSFASHGERGGREQAAKGMVDAAMRALGPAGGTIEPSEAGAQNFLNTTLTASLEGWFSGVLFEMMSSFVPFLEVGHLEQLGELNEAIIGALGLGRLSRRVLGPLVNIAAVTPLTWKLNKVYTPNLLAAGDVVRQVKRGRWSEEKGREELARQGWSPDRIEALFNAAAKFHSVSDLTLFERAGFWTREQARQHLQDQGWTEQDAQDELNVEVLKLDESYAMSMATAVVDGFVAGRIGESELRGLLADTGVHGVHLRPLHDLAVLRREMRQKELTSNEVEECVRAGVLAVVDYRQALEREGYSPAGVIAKELLLRKQLDDKKAVADHRRELELERAAEKEARRVAAEKRRLEVEAERAQQRRGPFASLARAAARGLIPFSRVEEVLAPDYDADTVAILLSLVEDDRQTYLEQQQRAEDARQRAARREISIADLEQAVLSGVLTVAEYRAGLVARKVDAGDVDILAATLAATLEDRLRAQQAHEDADAAAKDRSIDLGRYEQLVRRGVRTLPQYDALLASLGFGEAARADMDELLRLKIADDQTASALRAGAGAVDATTGWTVNEWRRAVLLQLRTVDQFGTALLAFDFTSDEQQLLIAELRDDVTAADAARARREQLAQPVEGRALSLSTVARAARLGIVTPATYQRRLEAAGYSADDIAIELDLLVTEIADVQAARALRDATPAPAGDKDLSLADLARAVRRGLRSLEDYRARALQLELTPAAADTLVRVLADELRATDASQARRKAIDTELSGRNLSLAELENKVRAGDWTVAQFMDALEETGYERPDAELLGGLLARELDDAAATP